MRNEDICREVCKQRKGFNLSSLNDEGISIQRAARKAEHNANKNKHKSFSSTMWKGYCAKHDIVKEKAKTPTHRLETNVHVQLYASGERGVASSRRHKEQRNFKLQSLV